MRSTFWPNRILEPQSSQNRPTGLKFSSKREKQLVFIKFVQNALFRSCGARFGQIAFLRVKVFKIVKLASFSSKRKKQCALHTKLYKTHFSGHAQDVSAKSHYGASKFSKLSRGLEILFKTGKQCAFYKNCARRSFQVMRSKFRPNRSCERQISQNRHTVFKFSSKRENSALSIKTLQNAFLRSCAARFGQIAFASVKVLKIVTLASNSFQYGKTVRSSWKLYKTHFSGHAQRVLAKSHFWASKFSKSSHWPNILFKTGKQCAFYKNCTRRSFQVMRSTFWPNRIFESQSSQNRETGLKFSSKRENSAHFMKIVQNALCRSYAARFSQIAFWSVKVLKIVTRAWNSLQNGKTVRFPWKLYKTLFSGHAKHVLAKSHFGASKFSKSSHWQKILFKAGKQCALHENYTKRCFQVMRSRFRPICIFERQRSRNRETILKFSLKNENSGLFKKIDKTLFSGHTEHVLAKSHFWESKFSKSWNWPQILFKTGKQCALHTKLYKTHFSGHALDDSAKSHFGASKFSKLSCGLEILLKTGKQCAFYENCTKRSFQVMRSTFCSNRILERQSSQNRHTGLKFPSKRKNSALSIKTLQNALLRSCAARFGQIQFASVKVLKIVTLASNSFQYGKTVRSSWKLYKTHFSGHAQHVLAKSHFGASKFSKSSHWQKTGKQCAFYKNCTRRSFQVMRSTFWPNRIFESQSSQNRETGLKFSSKRENSAHFMKIVQNALCRSYAARFGQIAFWSVKVFKIVTRAWNSLQNGKTVRFPWKLYKTLFSGHAKHVLAKSHFGASKFSKLSHWQKILFKAGKQCALHENYTKRCFHVMRSRFRPICIFERQRSRNRETILKFSLKSENSGLFKKIDKTLFAGHTEHVLAKSHFWESKFSKSWNWPQILFKTGKQCAFHENCTKRSFQVMRSFFSPNRNFERQSSENRHTGFKFSSKRENSALSIKSVQNTHFRSCAARFGQTAFWIVKVFKIVMASNSLQHRKTVRFPWKLYKTLFSGDAEHVSAKSHLRASKFSKSSHWHKILFKTGKLCALHENCTKRSFQVMRSTFWPNRILERQSSHNRERGLIYKTLAEQSL